MFIDENAQAAGSYLLGFMCMRINTTADMNDLNKLLESDKQVMSTFFHEYIHFLQNFTSTSGLYSSIFTTQYVKYAVSQVKGIKSDPIILPLTPDESFNRSAQDQLNQIYRGEAKLMSNVIYNCYYEQKISLDSGSGQFINVSKYEVNVTSYDTRKDYNYHFGATALKEYVAHTLQNQFFPTQHDDTPYLLAGLILDKELPDFTDIRLRITLCDATLMVYHPAELFFKTIEKLKIVGDNYPKQPKKFYHFLFDDLSFSGPLGSFSNVNELFKFNNDTLQEEYEKLFGSVIFEKELSWMKDVLGQAQLLRMSNPTFLLDLVDNLGNFTNEFKSILSTLGTPFFINSNSYGGFVPPSSLKSDIPNQPYLLYAASMMLSRLYTIESACSMNRFCSKSFAKEDPTNSLCLSNPFLKLKEPQLCSFSQVSNTWGLGNFNLQY